MKKIFINDEVYDVVEPEAYYNNKKYYEKSNVAIEKDGIVYPIIPKYSKEPGAVDKTVWLEFRDPPEEEKDKYSTNNILDFGAAKDLADIYKLNEEYSAIERRIMTDPEDNFKPPVSKQDSPEMMALKQAVSDKNINIKAYERRFGPTYENDIRIFNGHKITLRKLREMCNALDIQAKLTLCDISPDVENPMGTEITVNITGKGKDPNEGNSI